MKIIEMYAYVMTEADGTEGIPAIRLGDMAYPLVGADMARMDSFKPFVQDLLKQGYPVKLLRFKLHSTEEIVGDK